MVAQAKHGRLRPSLLSHTFNMRGKIAMPTPDNSCGNFINVALSHFTADDETKVQLHDFVDRVYNGIKNMVSDCARVSSDDELFVMAEKIRIETIKAFTRSEMDLYMFNSWCRMPVYQTDFGWGKPGWVSGLYVPGVEMVFLVDTKDGDGIEAWVSLEEDTMLLFQENPDIKAFTGLELQYHQY
ncbi:acetyl-CoA-benzylalcohol acetyltransferase [Populus alba x Populus x berolinensis]|nr:acetyl-CoA-benzylalcohol acetyltransferase [Populus alba x Populus x berolinensis]